MEMERPKMAAAETLLFGTAGVPKSTTGTSTVSGIRRIAELGLDCLEVEFVQGVKMGSDTAEKVRAEAKKNDVFLSAHAPYYINLNSEEEGKRLASQERILSSARMAEKCGAQCVVLHLGYYGKLRPDKAYEEIKKGLQEVVSILKAERNPVVLRPETMGKRAQFGSLEEVLFLCREVDGLQPCIDFSHIHARAGKANTYGEFYRILKKTGKKLGDEALKNMHIHISGSVYNEKGEIKHVNLEESDFLFDEWVQALKDFDVRGMVICESPVQENDALMLKNLYYE
jgi:deoxyribonuclease-4